MGRRRAGTLVLTAAMLAAGVALFLGPVEALPPTPSPMRLPWPVLAALFAAAVILRVQVQTDRETWDALAVLGCELAQGHYLAPPMAAAEATRWLWEQRAGEATPERPDRFTISA